MMRSVASSGAFESHRGLLFSIAYRMLGSAAEAEDVVQEAWLRWQGADASAIESERAWLSTVVTRLCLDQLKSARARREEYVGPWLPEPLRTDEKSAVDPESISLAFLVLLESLSPVERAVYLLHEVFDYPHAEVAAIVGQNEAACRQILHRAQEHVRARRPRFPRSREAHQRLLGSFLQAVGSGDLAGLRAVLADDVTLFSDGGGKVTAARNPILGADAVCRFLLGLMKKAPPNLSYELADLNGWPALISRIGDRVYQCLTIECDDDRIYGVRAVLNPDKLARL